MRGPPGTFPAVPAMYWSKRRSCCGDALRTTHPQHPPSLSCARYGHEDRTTSSATNVNRARARRRIFAGLLGPRRRGDRAGGAATPAAAAVSSRAGWASRSPAAKAGDPQRHHPHAERGTCRRLQHRVPRPARCGNSAPPPSRPDTAATRARRPAPPGPPRLGRPRRPASDRPPTPDRGPTLHRLADRTERALPQACTTAAWPPTTFSCTPASPLSTSVDCPT
jgi:hypothetical protein